MLAEPPSSAGVHVAGTRWCRCLPQHPTPTRTRGRRQPRGPRPGASTWRCECARKSGPGPSRGEKPQGGPSVGRAGPSAGGVCSARGGAGGRTAGTGGSVRQRRPPLPSRADAASRCPAPVCASCSSTRTELDSEKSIPRAHAGAQQIRSPPAAWAAAAASEKTGRGFQSRQREPDRARPILGQRDRPPPHPEGARGQTFRPLRS